MRTIFFLALISLILLFSCQPAEKVESLFNGKDLTGWDTYIGPSFDTINGKRDSIPLGLNNDPLKVFTVVEQDGKPALRISGERFGGISTRQEFYNYHFGVEFKWGEKKWHPREDKKRDSGVLYHAVGGHGADFGFWMRSQEFQVQEGDCGDYWGVAGGVFDVPVRKADSVTFIYDPKGEVLSFYEGSPNNRRVIKDPDAEKPNGEWNQIDIYCYGDTAVHMMNGKVVMVLYESRQLDGAQQTPLKKGKLQLQSEGAEVFYRNFQISPINKLPELDSGR